MKNLYYMSRKNIEDIGGRVAYDECFKPVKGVPGFFISNYGRLVSKRQRIAKICSVSIYQGYETYCTYAKKYGKYKRYNFKIHRLVAETFLEIPDWIKEEDLEKLVVHHLIKVSRNAKIYGLNTADNLVWLPYYVHVTLHAHERIEVLIGKTYKTYGFLDACKRLRITPYDLCNVLKHKTVTDNYNYYSADVKRDNGKTITVNIREEKK